SEDLPNPPSEASTGWTARPRLEADPPAARTASEGGEKPTGERITAGGGVERLRRCSSAGEVLDDLLEVGLSHDLELAAGPPVERRLGAGGRDEALLGLGRCRRLPVLAVDDDLPDRGGNALRRADLLDGHDALVGRGQDEAVVERDHLDAAGVGRDVPVDG